HVEAFLAPLDEAERVQHLQVLRNVRLSEAGRLHQLGDRLLSLAQRAENAKARRFGEGLEALGDQPQQLRRQRKASHEIPLCGSITVLEYSASSPSGQPAVDLRRGGGWRGGIPDIEAEDLPTDSTSIQLYDSSRIDIPPAGPFRAAVPSHL